MSIQFQLYQELLAIGGVLCTALLSPKDKSFSLFVLIAILFECCFVKIAAAAWSNNHTVYNVYIMICVYYYLEFFYCRISNGRILWYGELFRTMWLGYSVYNLLFGQGLNSVNNWSYALGMSIVILSVGAYLILQVLRNKSWNPRLDPAFWLAMGLLAFYIPLMPSLVYLDRLIGLGGKLMSAQVGTVTFANLILVFSYLITIICLSVQPATHGQNKSSI